MDDRARIFVEQLFYRARQAGRNIETYLDATTDRLVITVSPAAVPMPVYVSAYDIENEDLEVLVQQTAERLGL